MTAARVLKGTRAGGEFTTTVRDEPNVQLTEASQTPRDHNGFPTIDCSRCKGSGRSKYSPAQGHDRCYTCGGSGVTYEAGRVKEAVRAYAEALVKASRPQVRQLHAGDVVSPVYRNPSEAKWAKVEQVLVFPSRPTGHTVGPDGRRTPAEFTAVIQFADGSHMQTSTDALVARRGENLVDPEPFIARAEGRRAVRKVSRRR